MAKSFTGTMAVTLALAAVAGCEKKSRSPEECVRATMHLPDIQLDHPPRAEFTVIARKSHEPPKLGVEPGTTGHVRIGTESWTESKAHVTGTFIRFTRQEVSDSGEESPIIIVTPDHPQRTTDIDMFARFKKCGFTPAPVPPKG